MRIQQDQFIQEDLKLLRSHNEFSGKLGACIGIGRCGFVAEWDDGSREQKAVKILDPDYVARNFPDSDPDGCRKKVQTEYDWAQKIGYTKNAHLMRILGGKREVKINGRPFAYLIMPRLNTIETLEVEAERENQIVTILRHCCEGLQVLHRHPEIVGGRLNGMHAVVHCDIKPDNIFIEDGHFIIGDYSISQKVTDLENDRKSFSSYQNPYSEPGDINKTSDIYSLGWVLYYWLNKKTHPTMQDVEERKTGKLKPPASWGDNPELWDVFLKMTAPVSSQRYQRAEDVQKALDNAQKCRAERLSKVNALQQYDSGKFEGQLEVAGLVLIVTAACKIIQKIFGATPVPKDAEGRLHGVIKEDIDYLEGTFRGEWCHGKPKKGEFSYNGVKCSGNWTVKLDYRVPFSQFGYMIFSGLIRTDEEENFYQGRATIHWNSGTRFEADIRNSVFHNGIMTFQNNSVYSGRWETITNEQFVGIFCGEGPDFYGCGTRIFCDNTYYEGEFWKGSPASGQLVCSNRSISTRDPYIFRNAWNLLMEMRDFEGSFSGSWTAEGYPERGSYTFREGENVSGHFDYVHTEEYTGMLHNGKACGLGNHRLIEYMEYTGEFRNNCYNGWGTVKHQCGAFLYGKWHGHQIIEGILVLSDGTKKYSKEWNLGSVTLRNGNVLCGLFCDCGKRPSGIGEVVFSDRKEIFCGEVYEGKCGNGIHYDKEGNVI